MPSNKMSLNPLSEADLQNYQLFAIHGILNKLTETANNPTSYDAHVTLARWGYQGGVFYFLVQYPVSCPNTWTKVEVHDARSTVGAVPPLTSLPKGVLAS